jgi:hypothetical protein
VIRQHALDGLEADERVAVLARGGGLYLLVHRAQDSPADVRARARRDGPEVVATHLRDRTEVLDLVAEPTRHPDGEG